MSDWRQTNPNNRQNSSGIKITPIILVNLTTLIAQITLITKTTHITLVPTSNNNKITPKPLTTLI